jgi:hypothetical protein
VASGPIYIVLMQMRSMHSMVMVALLPIPIMDHNIRQLWLAEQWQTNRGVLNTILHQILQPLTCYQMLCADTGCSNVLYADGNFSCCKLVLTGWLAEYPEYSNLHDLEWHVCF